MAWCSVLTVTTCRRVMIHVDEEIHPPVDSNATVCGLSRPAAGRENAYEPVTVSAGMVPT